MLKNVNLFKHIEDKLEILIKTSLNENKLIVIMNKL
jgi:hypothetical protein